MRTIIATASAGVTLLACGVEPLPPPSNLEVASGYDAPPTPPPPPPPPISDDPACELFQWPLSVAQAAVVLKESEMFANEFVYLSGPPPQMAAFNVLLDQGEPLVWFDDIARTGGTVGRLYALCAFQILDPVRATRLAAELRTVRADAAVDTQFGCLGSRRTVPDLVDDIERRGYGKSFREARKRTYEYFNRPANMCIQAPAGAGR